MQISFLLYFVAAAIITVNKTFAGITMFHGFYCPTHDMLISNTCDTNYDSCNENPISAVWLRPDPATVDYTDTACADTAYTDGVKCPLRITADGKHITGLLFKAPAYKIPANNHPTGVTISGCLRGNPATVCAPLTTVQFPNVSMYETIFLRFDVAAAYSRTVVDFQSVRDDSRAAFNRYFPQVALIHDMVGVPPAAWDYLEINPTSTTGALVVVPFTTCFGRYYPHLDAGNPMFQWEGTSTTAYSPFTYTQTGQLPTNIPAIVNTTGTNSSVLFPSEESGSWLAPGPIVTATVRSAAYFVDFAIKRTATSIPLRLATCLSSLLTTISCSTTLTQTNPPTSWNDVDLVNIRIAAGSKLSRISIATPYLNAPAGFVFPSSCKPPYSYFDVDGVTCMASLPCTNKNQFTAANITIFTPTVCNATTNCTLHSEYESAPYTQFADTTCTPITKCTKYTQYLVRNYTRYTDTVCAPVRLVCPPGSSLVSNNTDTSDIVCVETVAESASNNGIIIGSVVGGVAGLAVVAIIIVKVVMSGASYAALPTA